MMDFVKTLFGFGSPAPLAQSTTKQKPPLPQGKADAFMDWYRAQERLAVELRPNPELPIGRTGSRLFGPGFLREGDEWPRGKDGRTLDFLAQLDLADSAALENYPREGILQFFIARSDLFGADFDNLLNGDYLVRHIAPDTPGALHEAPHKRDFDPSGIDNYSPSYNFDERLRGIGLAPFPVSDRIDLSVKEAELRFFELGSDYDLDPLYDRVDELDQTRPTRHHTGGYPAFVQSDIRNNDRYQDYNHVLLRLTSDDYLMWGDVGECVFMIRSDDLKKSDFSNVVYSWDCS